MVFGGGEDGLNRKVDIVVGGAISGVLIAIVALVPREDSPSPPVKGATQSPWIQGPDGGGAGSPAVAPSPADPREPRPERDEVSVLSLVDEMVDLDGLARTPQFRYVARQESSYDRRSRVPGADDSWFANDDFATEAAPNLRRVETDSAGRKRYVLLDARGPGAVVRMWTAAPAGTMRIWIDDDPRPALEAPMEALLSGSLAPFGPPIGQITARGYSLYFPFPFRSHCLITVDSLESIDPFSGRPVDRLYFQIGYRQYDAGVASHLRPFSGAELERATPAVARVRAALLDDAPVGGGARAGAPSVFPLREVRLLPGQRSDTSVAAPDAGGGAITRLRLVTPVRDPARLRGTILSIRFDGQETVRAPLGDFFGSGPGWNLSSSLPMTVGADGALTCRFVMPFRRAAVLSLVRERDPTDASPEAVGSQRAPRAPVEVSGEIDVEPRAFVAERRLLFHARFRPPESMATRPIRDWHVATLRGQGQQVGTMLEVANPVGTSWWGEGDEKIYRDGESFPGIFGTGTEDYFGYAWSSTALFSHPYHAQTLAPSQGFGGWFSMNRFLVADPVPFTAQLRFDLELWHWTDTTVRMAAMVYWYAAPGGRDDFPP